MGEIRRYLGQRVTRPELKGRLCFVVAYWRRRGKHNAMVQWLQDGEFCVVPARGLRRTKGVDDD